MNEEKREALNAKAKELAELVEYAKENFPLVAEFVNARTHNWKAKYAGVAVLVGAICELVQVVLG